MRIGDYKAKEVAGKIPLWFATSKRFYNKTLKKNRAIIKKIGKSRVNPFIAKSILTK